MSSGIRLAKSLLRSLPSNTSSSVGGVNPFTLASYYKHTEVTQHAAAASLLSPLDHILSCLPPEASKREGVARTQQRCHRHGY
mmetsp:Transcript_7804/g.13763  ORF Transcript_7804/g.13763 Transcript_7804/m.13763 type:complete len:83 (-) Transcript_7804:360-608(-)